MVPLVPPAAIEVGTPLAITSDGDVLSSIVLLFVAGLWAVYDGFRKWQQYRLMQDTARAKVRSAAVGRTEIQGTAHNGYGTVPRPFTAGKCLVAEYEIEEYHADDDGGHWYTLDSGVLWEPFLVDDGTGTIRVRPDDDVTLEISEWNELEMTVGSEDPTPEQVATFLREYTTVDVPTRAGLDGLVLDETRRYSQSVLPVDSPVYVLGATTPMDDPDDVASSDLLLSRDEASDEFIVADQTEERVVSKYRRRVPAQIVGGLALSALMLYLLLV